MPIRSRPSATINRLGSNHCGACENRPGRRGLAARDEAGRLPNVTVGSMQGPVQILTRRGNDWTEPRGIRHRALVGPEDTRHRIGALLLGFYTPDRISLRRRRRHRNAVAQLEPVWASHAARDPEDARMAIDCLSIIRAAGLQRLSVGTISSISRWIRSLPASAGNSAANYQPSPGARLSGANSPGQHEVESH